MPIGMLALDAFITPSTVNSTESRVEPLTKRAEAQGVGQYFLVIAFRFGEVAVLAPFRYFNLVWAVIYGYLFFGDVPQRDIIIGGAVVVGSGLFIWWRELRVKGRL